MDIVRRSLLSLRIAAVIAAIGATNSALAGFVEIGGTSVNEPPPRIEKNQTGDAIVSIDDVMPMTLIDEPAGEEALASADDFEIGAARTYVQDQKPPPPAVAAPLPPAILSGALMLAGNFVLARAIKRKI